MRILSELKLFFPDATHRQRIEGLEMDVFIPSLRLGVEFDGYYWHKGKKGKEDAKLTSLKRLGFKVIRLREKGLSLGRNDIRTKTPRDPCKSDIDNLLIKIVS